MRARRARTGPAPQGGTQLSGLSGFPPSRLRYSLATTPLPQDPRRDVAAIRSVSAIKAYRSRKQACPNHFAVPKTLRYRRTVRDGKGLLEATALPADYERLYGLDMLKTAQAKW